MIETYLLIAALFLVCYGVFRYAIELQDRTDRADNQGRMTEEFEKHFGGAA